MVSIGGLYEVLHWIFKEPIIGCLKSKMAEIFKINMTSFFFRGRSNLDDIWQTGEE